MTLLLETSGSPVAWKICRDLPGPLPLASLQQFTAENRLKREMESESSSDRMKAMAAGALQNFRWYVEQEVFQISRLDYEIAIDLAAQWQKRMNTTAPGLLLLWPAIAATTRSTHFLSFDPRSRRLAASPGMELLPAKV